MPALTFVIGVLARQCPAHQAHLLAEKIELGPHHVGTVAVRFDVGPSLGRQGITLAITLHRHRRVPDLLEIGQGRIDHPRARRVETIRASLEELDELIAVTRRLGQQRDEQQLKIIGTEFPAAREIVSAAAEPAA